jgi:hypothetical protein
MKAPIELGKKYGRLTAIRLSHRDKRRNAYYVARCDCGKEKTVSGSYMHTGRTLSCGCINGGRYQRLGRGVAVQHIVFRGYKNSAKRRGHEFGIEFSEFVRLTSQTCYYCGEQPQNAMQVTKYKYNGTYVYNGLDRLDSQKGYLPDNVVPCCRRCNLAKGTSTAQEFRNWIHRAFQHTNIQKLQ